MKALSAKQVQSPFKRTLYRNDVKHVKVKTEERMASLMKKKSHVYESVQNKFISLLYLHLIFFTPSYREYISCTISISTRSFKLRVHKDKKEKEKRKLEWRGAYYSKTNYGPLTRLTLFYYSFVIH